MKKLLLTTLLLAAPALSQATQCGAPGTSSVLEGSDPSNVVVLLNLQKDGVALSFNGKDYQPRTTTRPGYNVFKLDGGLFQVITLPVAPLLEGGARPEDAELLTRHARQQADAAIARNTPLTRFEALGTEVRDYKDGTPPRTFKLWRLTGPDEAKVSQYFLATVVGDEIVTLNAIVTDPVADLARFMRVRAEYVARFRPLAEKDCATKP